MCTLPGRGASALGLRAGHGVSQPRLVASASVQGVALACPRRSCVGVRTSPLKSKAFGQQTAPQATNRSADNRELQWTGKVARAVCISMAAWLFLWGPTALGSLASHASTCPVASPQQQDTISTQSAACTPLNSRAVSPTLSQPTATVAMAPPTQTFSVTDKFGRFLLVEWVFGDSDLLDLLSSWSWDFGFSQRDDSPLSRIGGLTKPRQVAPTAPAPAEPATQEQSQLLQPTPVSASTGQPLDLDTIVIGPSDSTAIMSAPAGATTDDLVVNAQIDNIMPLALDSTSNAIPHTQTEVFEVMMSVAPDTMIEPEVMMISLPSAASVSLISLPTLPSESTPLTAAAAQPAVDTPAASTLPSSSTVNVLSALTSEEEALALPPIPTQFPELPPLVTPEFQQVYLSNGLRVVLLEDHEVPIVRGSLIMKGGMHASPSDKVGLASIAMAVQRAGGSLLHPGSTLDLRLEELAAAVETGARPQALTLDFFSASDDLPEVLGLWAEVLRQAALPQDKLVLYQDQVLNSIEHRNDDATTVARRSLARLMYGPTSVYARQPTKNGVTSIHVEDIREFLDTWQRPDNGILGLVGDFTPSTIIPVLEQLIGSWVPASGQPQQPPKLIKEVNALAPAEQVKSKVFVVDRPGLSQASVATSEPGISLMDPDAYPLDVLSTSLNSFGGQLFDQIRSREGLAYSVYGSWDLPPDRPGTFLGGGETSAPGAFIQGLRRVLQQATQVEPAAEVIDNAKAEALNAFVFNFASKSAILQRRLVYDILELPPDLLFRYRDGVQNVTPQDVLGAAQRHLHPNEQVTVVVGDAKTIVPELESAGLAPIPLPLDDGSDI